MSSRAAPTPKDSPVQDAKPAATLPSLRDRIGRSGLLGEPSISGSILVEDLPLTRSLLLSAGIRGFLDLLESREEDREKDPSTGQSNQGGWGELRLSHQEIELLAESADAAAARAAKVIGRKAEILGNTLAAMVRQASFSMLPEAEAAALVQDSGGIFSLSYSLGDSSASDGGMPSLSSIRLLAGGSEDFAFSLAPLAAAVGAAAKITLANAVTAKNETAIFLAPESPFFLPELASLMFEATLLARLDDGDLIDQLLRDETTVGGFVVKKTFGGQIVIFLQKTLSELAAQASKSVSTKGRRGRPRKTNVSVSGSDPKAAAATTARSTEAIDDAGEYIPGSKKEQAALRRMLTAKAAENTLQVTGAIGRLIGEAATGELGMAFVADVEEAGAQRRVFLWPQAIDLLHYLGHSATEGGYAHFRRYVQSKDELIYPADRGVLLSLCTDLRDSLTGVMAALRDLAPRATAIREEVLLAAVMNPGKYVGDKDAHASSLKLAQAVAQAMADSVRPVVEKSITALMEIGLEAIRMDSLRDDPEGSGDESRVVSAPTRRNHYVFKNLSEQADRFRKSLEKLLLPTSDKTERSLMNYVYAWELVRLANEAKRLAEESGQLDILKSLSHRVKAKEFIRRGGRDVSDIVDPDSMIRAFSVRGVQWGEYVTDERRRDILARASSSLRDLADAIGVEDTSLGLGGTLALAFGARGSGRPSATYEPGTHVINMTRDRGDGSLAHEIFHSIDFLGKTSSALSDMSHRADLPEEVRDAMHRFKKVMMTAPREEFVARRRKESEELATIARQSREAYLEAKKALQARHSEDLAEHHAKRPKQEVDAGDTPEEKAAFEAWRLKEQSINQSHNKAMVKIDYRRLMYNRLSALAAELAVEADLAESNRPLSSSRRISSRSKGLPLSAIDDLADASAGETCFPSKFLDDASELDAETSKKGGYWATPHECGARAFEMFVAEKLKGKDAWNNYLVDDRCLDTYSKSPYPMGDDKRRICEALEELLATLKRHKIL